jgi:mycothiol synthase
MLVAVEDTDRRGWVDTLDDRQRDFDDPASNIETDTILGFTPAGQLAALGWVFTMPPTEEEHLAFLWGEVHPQHRQRGLGNLVLTWMEARTRAILDQRPNDLPHHIRTNTPDHLPDRVAFFEEHGYQLARAYYRMRRDLDQPIPEVHLPPGIALRTYSPELDQVTMQAIDESFIDHWGHIPMDPEVWQLFFVGTPDFRPDLTYIAMAEDGQVAGVCYNEIHQEENRVLGVQQGWIRALGVRRPWRKQGLGTALLCASMRAFQQAGMDYAGLGVDAENITGALRIYEQLGFYVIQRFLAYSKTV